MAETEIAYLMGADAGRNQFFSSAKGFLEAHGATVVRPTSPGTLEDVFRDLDALADAGKRFDVISLVTHATGFSSLEFGLTRATQGQGITATDVTNALAAARSGTPTLRPPSAKAVTTATHVRLYGCDVGKDEAFLKSFGMLFGQPADIMAPLRVAVFRQEGTTFTHRLARTWSLTWPSDITATPAAQWPTAAQTFAGRAGLKFGTEAERRSPDPLAASAVTGAITAAATAASAQPAPAAPDSFFFAEYFPVTIPSGTPDPQAYVMTTVKPTRSAVLGGTEVSDLTVPLTVGPADVTDRSHAGTWKAHVAVLAQVIEPVALGNAAHYRTTDVAPARAPSTGPKPVGDGGAPPPPPARTMWEQATDAFLAAGGTPAEVDALLDGLSGPPAEHALVEPRLPVVASAAGPEDLVEEPVA